MGQETTNYERNNKSMKYELTDYQGNIITLPADKANKIAGIASLIEVEVNGQTHFINPSNIASIKPLQGAVSLDKGRTLQEKNDVDYRGTISEEKYAEVRARFKSKML